MIYTSKGSSRFLVKASLFVAVAFVGTTPLFASADVLYRQLQVGSTGSDVGSLQTFLAQDVTIYPSARVTNYFGSLTSDAVSRFQVRNGISAVGRVGPITMATINEQMSGSVASGVDVSAPMIFGLNVSAQATSATMSWTTNEFARGTVYYSTSPLMVFETPHNITVTGAMAVNDNNLRSSESISIQDLQSNTVYYFMVYSSDALGNVNVSWPSTFRTN